MIWATVGTPIKLDIDWQFTDPVDGLFFRFKHENQPANAIYEIAQVELNDDGSYTLFDSQVLSLEKGFLDTIKLAKPGIFTQRRLAIRRIPARPTLEQEIRRLLLPGYLQPSDLPPNVPARNRWQVQIESSNYVEPSAAVDLSPIQTKLNEISSKIDNLQSSGGSTSGTTKTLTYSSDGDTNGVCYWIGTNFGAEAWNNPHIANRVVCSIIQPFDSNRFPADLVDRQPSGSPATSDAPNSKMRIDLGLGNKLKPNYYSLRGADRPNLHLRSWAFQGSNDLQNWVDLDTQVNNSAINQNTWFSGACTAIEEYRYLQIKQTGSPSDGTNIMTLGEWEFYGEFIKQ
jgi:E3 ubiquitin-protein ligase HECTD1